MPVSRLGDACRGPSRYQNPGTPRRSLLPQSITVQSMFRPHLDSVAASTMAKRQRDGDGEIAREPPATKRNKSSSPDRLSSLSDELLLKVLSFLPISQLVVCQRYVDVFQLIR